MVKEDVLQDQVLFQLKVDGRQYFPLPIMREWTCAG